MYVWAPVPNNQSSLEFAKSMLDNAAVATIPGVAFGPHGEGFIRIALVQPENRLMQAVDRNAKWLG